MKRIFFKSIAATMLAALIVFACSKELNEGTQSQDIQITDGMLHFKDFDHFYKTLDLLRSDTKSLKDLGIDGFHSAREAYAKYTKEHMDKEIDQNLKSEIFYWKKKDGELYLEHVFDTEVQSELFNTFGNVRCGDYVMKYTPEKVYVFKYQYLHGAKDLDLITGVEVLEKGKNALLQKSICYASQCSFTYEYRNGNQFRQVRGARGQETSIFVIGVGWVPSGRYYYWVQNWKRGAFGAWYREKAPLLTLEDSGSEFFRGTDISELDFYTTTGYCFSEHFVKDGNGNTVASCQP